MGDTTYMCPLCDDCTNWHLGDICFTTKLNRMFDNVAIVIYSFILNIWCKYVILSKIIISRVNSILFSAIGFLELWRLYSKKLNYKWGLLNYEDEVFMKENF
jgi:hypothetical protein